MFIDEVSIVVHSGRGGRGCESYFRRWDHKRLPNGGDGGDGGNVVLKANPTVANLYALRSKPVFEAEAGGAGLGNNCYGRKGKDCIVRVPCGTTIYNKHENLLIRDLGRTGEEEVILKGGRGGYGNHAGREPTFGEGAQELELLLSFKIIADIFLVGLPNSGKTTLLRKLTHARVNETAYPFATKVPQLGTYQSDTGQYCLCELPSVYGHSEKGRGLGVHFLKHLERARLIFFLLDPEGQFAENMKEGYEMLLETVAHFNPDFVEIPRFIVINKADLIQKLASVKKIFPKTEKVYFVSAAEETGLKQLMAGAAKRLGV